MKTVEFILKNITGIQTFPEKYHSYPIKQLRLDSRDISDGDCFLAYPGQTQDGRQFIVNAIQSGATSILYDAQCSEQFDTLLRTQDTVAHASISGLAKQISAIAGNFFGHPSKKLDCVAVTGTNGKSSISHYITQMWGYLGQPAALMGTVGKGKLKALKSTKLTTADPITIQADLADFLKQGDHHVTLEASSHALDQGRLESLHFQSAHFTNLTHEHLDYHKSMATYGAAKARLFHFPGLKQAIINIDAPFSLELQTSIMVPIISYAFHSKRADFYILKQIPHQQGMHLTIMTPEGTHGFDTSLIGAFNASNLLAVLAEFYARGYPLKELISHMPRIQGLAGRMQKFKASEGDPLIIIDYAHTPDALSNVLRSLRKHPHRKIYCIFGCGGDRDPGKRPEMGHISEKLADHSIICNDNPRTENPLQIAQMILSGMKHLKQVHIELDRTQAIHQALSQASPQDIVLIAGKGHEDYQLIGDQRIDFSDWKVVTRYYDTVASSGECLKSEGSG